MVQSITPGLGYIYTNINLWQSTESAESLNDVLVTVSSIAGDSANRSLIPRSKIVKVFDVVHTALDTSQKEWVENFYAVNRDTTFYFNWKADGLIYRVQFIKSPKFHILTTGWWKVELSLQVVSDADEIFEVLNPTVTPPSTLLVLMDIPLLNAAHSELGFYWAVTPTSLGDWSSAELYRATTAGVSYSKLGSTTLNATIGVTTNSVGVFYGKNTFDELNKITVRLFNVNKDKTLTSAAATAVLAETNLIAVGSELIGFKHVLPMDNDTYVLTGLLRGRHGTEWAMSTHYSGEYVVLLDSNINRHTDVCDNINTAYKFKTTVNNNSSHFSNIVDFTDTGESAKPLSPVYLKGSQNPSTLDWTLNWIRRARINAEWEDLIDVPLDEPVERYHIALYSNTSYTTVSNNYTASGTPTITLSNAQVSGSVFSNKVYFSVAQMTGDDPVCVTEGRKTYGTTC